MLTRRERQILDRIKRCESNKNIALGLNISESTVKNHLTNLYGKLDIPDWANSRMWTALNAENVQDLDVKGGHIK